MTRTVSATEAKNNLGSILKSVRSDGEPIVIETRREPTAVVISIEKFQELEVLSERERKRKAMVDLRELAEQVSARNKDMTEEEIEEFAEYWVREAVDSMVRRGVIRFEE